MGGVVSALACLLVRNKCSASNTASELLFFPPNPPCCTVVAKEGAEGEFELVVDASLEVTMVRTKRKKQVVCVWYKCVGARYTLLHSHGNATDIGAMHDRYVGLVRNCNVAVVAYDYTGYGASQGARPTEKDTYSDLEAAYQWVVANCTPDDAAQPTNGAPPRSSVVLYGQSVGSGPTCYLASREHCAGVILHSPILSGMRVLTESRALGCLDVYPNIDRIRKVRCPVLIIHGQRDVEVHWEHGRRLHESTPDEYKREPWWPADLGHNDIGESESSQQELYQRVRSFLDGLAAQPQPESA